MTPPARISGALVALALALSSTGAAADLSPSRPIRIIVPYAVGGADLITRLVAQSLTASLAVAVIVENRAGGGGTLATKAVPAAEPDGYTLLTATNGPFAIGPAIYRNVGYDPIKSFAPIAYLAGAPEDRSWADVARVTRREDRMSDPFGGILRPWTSSCAMPASRPTRAA